ncbi:MAG: hypothetical protein A2176_00460 [Spirochaetes bacterium RBG_13_51_14]|nr:MAG: hypothetical protein A2176_00460 [Spirochaetes bacterium RBG_13_51_14]
MGDDSINRLMNGTTWTEFCDTLKKAGEVIVRGTSPADPLNRAEGYRYLSRITRAVVEAFVENSDPRAPVLFRPVHETAKMGADNPDNYYQYAAVSGEYDYLARGSRGTVNYLGFGTYKGNYGIGGTAETGYLDGRDLAVNNDGTFQLILSRNKHDGNWLPMKEETSSLIVRQTFADRTGEEIARLTIERIGGDGMPTPVTPEMIEQGITTAARIVLGAATLFANWAEGFMKHLNQLPRFDSSIALAAMGDPNISYYHSYWKLADDEALVIDVKPPACEAWNFQLNNHWMESLDYRYYPVWVNQHTAKYRPDGSVRIVVAHKNPGADNWIDTVGHGQGTMLLRWVRAEDHPEPRTRVVKVNEVKGLI